MYEEICEWFPEKYEYIVKADMPAYRKKLLPKARLIWAVYQYDGHNSEQKQRSIRELAELNEEKLEHYMLEGITYMCDWQDFELEDAIDLLLTDLYENSAERNLLIYNEVMERYVNCNTKMSKYSEMKM